MSKKEELLKAAQLKVRSGGYNNFSFRELAAEVGIKSASVHYHFPTKEDLGAELARQYTDNFIKALGDPLELQQLGQHPIQVYVEQFRQALVEDKKMCLCGLLGAEVEGLPEQVRYETQRFFERNLQWLEKAHEMLINSNDNTPEYTAQQAAIKTVSMLEGAMLVSKALDNNDVFEQATQGLFA